MDPFFSLFLVLTASSFSSDLFKWCKRSVHICALAAASKVLSTQARESIFLEAVDCFCGMIGKLSLRKELLQVTVEKETVPESSINDFLRFLALVGIFHQIVLITLRVFINRICKALPLAEE
jgi:hypothetical protein